MNETTLKYYDSKNNETEKEKSAVCKTVEQKGSGYIDYYILSYNGVMYDPVNNAGSNINPKYRKVSEKTFDTYRKYLDTRRQLYYQVAQRGLNDGI